MEFVDKDECGMAGRTVDGDINIYVVSDLAILLKTKKKKERKQKTTLTCLSVVSTQDKYTQYRLRCQSFAEMC